MKFTLEQIQQAHSKVKNGADFPRYVQEIKNLGVAGYTQQVADGKTNYFDAEKNIISSDAKYPELKIAESVNKENFTSRLKLHQQGGTDYLTFCSDCAENGVEGWTLDFAKMTCSYFDKEENEILVETIQD